MHVGHGRAGLRTAAALAWAVLAWGALSLLIAALAPLLLVPMTLPVTRPITAVVLIVAAGAVLVRLAGRSGVWRPLAWVGTVLAVVAVVLNLTTGLPAPAPYDHYLVEGSAVGAFWNNVPLLLLCAGLLASRRWGVRLMQVAALLAYVSLLASIFGASSLDTVGSSSALVGTSLATLLLLEAGVICIGGTSGSLLLRRTGLPRATQVLIGVTVLVLPPLLLLVGAYGTAQGWWSHEAADAVAAAAVVGVLYVMVDFGVRNMRVRREVDEGLLHRVASAAVLDEVNGVAQRFVLEALPVGVAEVDAAGSVVWANPAWWGITGLRPGGISAGMLTDLIHPEDRAAMASARAAGGGTVRTRLVRADGQTRYVELSRYDDLAVVGGAGARVIMIRDRTDAAIAEIAADEANEAYRFVTHNASDAITRLLPGGVVTWASPSVGDVLGIPADKLVGTSLRDRIHPGDLAELAAKRAALQGGDSSVDYEYRWQQPDGSYRWMGSRITVTHDETGADTGTIALTRDIHDLVEARRTLAQSERRFRQTMQSSPIATTLADASGRFIAVNDAACAMFGYTADELLTKQIPDLVHPDDLTASREMWHSLMDGTVDYGRAQKRYLRADGKVLWGDMTITMARDDDGAFLHSIAQVVDITDAMAAMDMLSHRALHDSLTGLPNRELVLDHLDLSLARTTRTDRLTGVLFVDLDHFKAINDAMGHAVGDQVIRAVADRMRTAVRAVDTVGRIGGDEFVVVLDDLPDEATATELVDRIRNAVAQPLDIGAHTLVPSLSIGITTSAGSYSDPADMLRDADTALYRAKANGRGRYETFDESMRLRAVERLAREEDVRRAIDGVDGYDLAVYLQPLHALEDRTLLGHEALVRLVHPELGVLAPDRFLAVAEEAGLMVGLGQLMFDRVLDLLAAHAVEDGGPGFISVNASPTQLAASNLAEHVIAKLAETGVDPHRVVVEITEQTLLSSASSSRKQLDQLAAHGVRLAIDDFGTGYAALAYLRDLPVTFVKLDKSFVDGVVEHERDRRMAGAVADLMYSLGIVGIAEGIETQEQACTLYELGWPIGQGYLFGRPQAGADVLARSDGGAGTVTVPAPTSACEPPPADR